MNFNRFNDDSLAEFNLVGSVCSIIALFLTASARIGLANLTQIAFGVVVGVSFGGILMRCVHKFYKDQFGYYSSFFGKCLFWLFVGVLVALVAFLVGRFGYWIMDLIIDKVVLPLLDV